jgi:hypothetical protein
MSQEPVRDEDDKMTLHEERERDEPKSVKKELGGKDLKDTEDPADTEVSRKLDKAIAKLKELGDLGDKPSTPPPGKRQGAFQLVREAADILGKTVEDPDGHQWKGPLPKGWTTESREKFWNSLTGRAPKHKVTRCIKKMKGKVEDPGAFCAALADREIPGWRAEAAKDRRKKGALKAVREASSLLMQPLRTRRDYGEQPTDRTDRAGRPRSPTEDETSRS